MIIVEGISLLNQSHKISAQRGQQRIDAQSQGFVDNFYSNFLIQRSLLSILRPAWVLQGQKWQARLQVGLV
ncbi:MAG: hypothetical protein N3E49_00760 [Bacteroidia bacterium]|nr:hypothetical protein [Bacteroidia bacterium]